MSQSKIAYQRLQQQRLAPNPFATPGEVVDWLGAVQSQDYPGAKWSLGMRMAPASDAAASDAGATDAGVERAFNEGAVLRTHIMRPTWHFVSPADIRWMQELTAAQVIKKSAYQHRNFALDEAVLARCNDVIATALEGGKPLTRAELGEALTRAGVPAETQRLGHIVHYAEVNCVICSGPRRGKQFTYMLLAERAPNARSLPRDEALAELARRYFTGHGPATIRDFAWWSGLSMADVRAGLRMAAPHLASETIDGQEYYFSAGMSPAAEPPPAAFLLPTYDEYHVGYANFGQAILFRREGRYTPGFDSTILFGGRVIGTWRRTLQKAGVIVELRPLAPFSSAEKAAVGEAAERYGNFLGLPVTCTYNE